MKKRILAIIGLIAYLAFITWFTIKDLPPLHEIWENVTEKNSVTAAENAEPEEK
ncbi:MAG: hypothetical protein IJD97_04275 [Clostridia bacterium]|nr:hypothetical protein [Clostridia bacterium]